MTEIERIEVIKILRSITMGIKLASVLITLLISSAVMFAGCIEKDKTTKVSEITASPTSTPIILPTSTPTSGTGMVNLENPLIPQEFQADYFTGVKKVQKV